MIRLAFIVSHTIQYYVPLYQRLAHRDDIEVKVFFTWHDGSHPVHDSGFRQAVVWDLPLTEGYDYELVSNVSSDPGTHHFWGLRNPQLVARVRAWRPDVVHVTGWAWASHLWAMWALHQAGIPTLFRGDSHLLDGKGGRLRWWLKRSVLRQVFSWPHCFLYVGQANRSYYEEFDVRPDRLYYCPHSIDVTRFAEPALLYEQEAREWRRALGIADCQTIALFAGKFEPKKRPVDLMQAVLTCSTEALVLVLVGNGVLETEVKTLAAAHPTRFRVLPFQNQRKMPVVYRLGDLFVLPSGWGESWGLAVNEALACSRPVLVSDRVGCAADVLSMEEDDNKLYGSIFSWNNEKGLVDELCRWVELAARLDVRRNALERAKDFDIGHTEQALLDCVKTILS